MISNLIIVDGERREVTRPSSVALPRYWPPKIKIS